eukprot:6617-Heterococcus_DN1.PRE.1
MAAAVSSCTSTVWDSHWDHHMRRIVSSFNLGKAEHEVLFEALAGSCTQLKAAKKLTFESSVLQRVPEHLRSRFLSAVAAASATEGGPQFEVLELPHPFERQLFLIIRDDTVVRADPERKLIHAVFRERTLRLREARALTIGQLLDVPEVARERFLQLMQALPDTA